MPSSYGRVGGLSTRKPAVRVRQRYPAWEIPAYDNETRLRRFRVWRRVAREGGRERGSQCRDSVLSTGGGERDAEGGEASCRGCRADEKAARDRSGVRFLGSGGLTLRAEQGAGDTCRHRARG